MLLLFFALSLAAKPSIRASRRYSTGGYPSYRENPDSLLPNPLADSCFRFSFLQRENRAACGTEIPFSPAIRDPLQLTVLLTVHRPF